VKDSRADIEYFDYRNTANITARTAAIAWAKCEATSAARPRGVDAPGADGGSIVSPGFQVGCSEEVAFTGSGVKCPTSVPSGCTCSIDEGGDMDEMCCE
jgi:hypothetical protein